MLWLEQFLASYPGAVLAVTHDRYFLDNVAEWIWRSTAAGLIPYQGNYSTYLEKKAERPVQGKKDQKLQKRLRKNSPGCVQGQGPPDQEQGPSAAVRGDGGRGEKTRKLDFEEIQIPTGRVWATWWWRRATSTRVSATAY